MSGRIHQRQKPAGNLRAIMHAIPWRFLLLAPFVLLIVVPVFQYGMHVGQHFLPAVTNFFYDISGPAPLPAPTPLPSFPTTLPQAGVVLYTVQADDSCDEILTMQMRMADAGQIFQ